MTTVFVDRRLKIAIVDSRQTVTTLKPGLISLLMDNSLGKSLFNRWYEKDWFQRFVNIHHKKTNKVYIGHRVQKEISFQMFFAGRVSVAEDLYKELCLSYNETEDILKKLQTKHIVFWMKEGDNEWLFYEGRVEKVDCKASWFIYGSIRDTFAEKSLSRLPRKEMTEKKILQILRYGSLFDKGSDNDYKIWRW